MSSPVAVFKRPAEEKAYGFLSYLASTLMLVLLAFALAASVVIPPLAWLKVPETIVMLIVVVAFIPLAILAIKRGYREYMTRAFSEVRFYHDRIEIGTAKDPLCIPLKEIHDIRVTSFLFDGIVRLSVGEKSIQLPKEFVTYSATRDVLRSTVVPRVAEHRFSAGQDWSLPVSQATIRGNFGMLLSIPTLLAGLFLSLLIVTIQPGVRMIKGGKQMWTRSRRAAGAGFTVTPDGIEDRQRMMEWKDIETFVDDLNGFEITYRDGTRLTASCFSGNSLLAAHVIARQVAATS